MPLPAHALDISGGCNCGAIRYKVAIPELAKRPLHPTLSSSSNPVHLPFVCTDHCNDCRRATGSILPAWICAPSAIVTASVVLRSSASAHGQPQTRPGAPAEQRSAWLPAGEVFKEGPISNDSFLTFYASSDERRRSFCARCGTNLTYAALPMPAGWPDMLDIILGTLDREDLEHMAPERQLWWNYGIDWVKKFSVGGGVSLPIHPSYKVDETVSLD